MNVGQIAQQIAWALNPTNFSWGEGLLEPILGRVIVGPASPDVLNMNNVLPWAIVHVENQRDHEENPADLTEEARLTLYLFAGNATNQAGQAAVVGGNRAALGSSRGMGLLDMEPLIKGQLFNQIGLVARPRSTGSQPVAVAGQMNGLLAERALDITLTRIPGYPDYGRVCKLLVSAAGGIVTASWAASPSRYDLVGYVWARASGSTAPTDPTTGTFVASTTPSFTDLPGAGTWSYSFWWAYDMTRDPWTGNGVAPVAPNRYSGYTTAQGGLVFVPASATVVV